MLVYFILFLLSNAAIVDGCHDNEREALLSFKSKLTDPSERLSSWQGQNCCKWRGIRCSESFHVVAVDLRNPNPSSSFINFNSEHVSTSNTIPSAINGTISTSLFTLAHLRYLDLSFNNFMHSKIPSGLSNLTELIYLNVSNAMFSDSITTQFANLTSLRLLDASCSIRVLDYSSISYNLSTLKIQSGAEYAYIDGGSLSSSSLNWLQGLKNLRNLVLDGVDLSVTSRSIQWAEPISVLSNLRLLSLSNCRISGNVPVNQLLNLTHLSYLVMDFNSLTSKIPEQLANLSSLSLLVLTNSKLQGLVPYLPQLKELYLGNNSDLIIDLHSMFAVPWPQLEYFEIQSTQVMGSIPYSFGNTTSLIHFVAYNCHLQGSIPDSMMNLSRLEVLRLDFNSITGNLPASISSLKNLQLLYLIQNSLEGSIPSSVCNISSLQYLALTSNSFTGIVPDCIGKLPNIIYFSVSDNKLNGTINSLASLFQNSSPVLISLGSSGLSVETDKHPFPPSFQPKVLELSSCNLVGTIPEFISKLTELEFLNLSNNSLSGSIPFWLFNLPKLGLLDLSLNNLQGFLPPNLRLQSYFGPTELNLARNNLQGSVPSLLENIDAVDLSGNNFTGYIPAQLGIASARFLSLSGNTLFGQIPSTLCQASNEIMLLDLSNNSLSGAIPASLGNCTSLIFLNLGQNELSGEIPSELDGAKNLSYLDLSDNHFAGPFPSLIQNLQSLMVLKMGNNRFQGRIPNFIGNLQNLQIFVLQSNFINGSIPQELNMLGKLQFLDLSSNKLSGPIPELSGLQTLRTSQRDGNILGYIISSMFVGVELSMVSKGILQHYVVVKTYLTGMDLSSNYLTGNIPSQIGLLQGLFMLNLSHNKLSGEIPNTIGEMNSLESLDLSFNHLGGEIPTALTFLDFLSTFNLSYNNLSGKIPTGQHFDTLSVDGSAYIGNHFLCGAPDGISCNRNTSTSLERSSDDSHDFKHKLLLYGFISLGYGVGLWGFFGVLYLVKENWRNRYWAAIDRISMRITHMVKKED